MRQASLPAKNGNGRETNEGENNSRPRPLVDALSHTIKTGNTPNGRPDTGEAAASGIHDLGSGLADLEHTRDKVAHKITLHTRPATM